MKEFSAFVPGHISGFFEPHVEMDDSLKKGSRNAGPCTMTGVTTHVSVEEADKNSLKIKINGTLDKAPTSRAVAKHLLKWCEKSYRVSIEHKAKVPIGCGYGASGAGALGTAIALSRALQLHLSQEKLVAIAHLAEVECHTGLGDVGAQAMGGLVVGLREGGPPYGKWTRIQVEPDLKVVCCTLGPISTKKFLTNEKFTQRAKRCGRVAMKKLLRNLTLENFLHTSYEFSKDTGLLDGELDTLIKEGERAGAIGGSVVMIGKAVFLFTPANRLKQVKRALLEHCAREQLMITEVGGRAHYLA